MTKLEVAKGELFGSWRVIKELDARGKHRYFKCLCTKCNVTIKEVSLSHLRGKNSMSCQKCANTTHGMSRGPLYQVWYSMNKRCYNKEHASYSDYGGRGVTVCKDWRKSNPMGLENFVKWAEKNGYREGLQLDKDIKIPGNKEYCPRACSFVTPKTNSNEKSNNVMVKVYWGLYKGQTMTIRQAWDKAGGACSYHAACHRYRRGWTLKSALTTPTQRTKREAA